MKWATMLVAALCGCSQTSGSSLGSDMAFTPARPGECSGGPMNDLTVRAFVGDGRCIGLDTLQDGRRCLPVHSEFAEAAKIETRGKAVFVYVVREDALRPPLYLLAQTLDPFGYYEIIDSFLIKEAEKNECSNGQCTWLVRATKASAEVPLDTYRTCHN